MICKVLYGAAFVGTVLVVAMIAVAASAEELTDGPTYAIRSHEREPGGTHFVVGGAHHWSPCNPRKCGVRLRGGNDTERGPGRGVNGA